MRRCSRPGCGKVAVATLTYAYSKSTAVVGPLAPVADPRSWDLCQHHADRITAPLGWEMLRVESIRPQEEDERLTELAEAVREIGRIRTGLVLGDERPRGITRRSDSARDAYQALGYMHPSRVSARIAREVDVRDSNSTETLAQHPQIHASSASKKPLAHTASTQLKRGKRHLYIVPDLPSKESPSDVDEKNSPEPEHHDSSSRPRHAVREDHAMTPSYTESSLEKNGRASRGKHARRDQLSEE